MVPGLLDGGGKCRIVRLAVAGLCETFGGGASLAHYAAEHPGGLTEPARSLSAAIRDEFRAPRIAAAFAIKLELKAGVGS